MSNAEMVDPYDITSGSNNLGRRKRVEKRARIAADVEFAGMYDANGRRSRARR